MKYHYSIIEGHGGCKVFLLPKEISLVEQVFYDMESFKKPIFLPFIEKVLYEESDYQEFGGNVCNLSIRKKFTEVYVEFVSPGQPDTCIIETVELLKLIKIWVQLNKEKLRSI